MPDETVSPQTPQTPPGTLATESSGAPSISPTEFARLQDFEQRARPYLEKILPYENTISKYVEDENYRSLIDNAQKSYDAMQKEQDTTPDYIKPINEKLDKVDKFIGKYEEQQTQVQQLSAAQARISKIGEQYPDLAADNYKIVADLGNELGTKGYSVDQFVSLVETLAPRLVAAAPKRETPPPSLRGDVSTTGAVATPAPQFKNLKERGQNIERLIRKAVGGR